MKAYDFVLAGGGVSGLSLACHLIHSPLRDRTILIVDKNAKNRNDRTLCFWSDRPTLFDAAVCREWRQLRFVGEAFDQIVPLDGYRYKLIRGLDFYQFARQELSAYANVDFVQGTLNWIEDDRDGARVWVDGQTFAGRWVFDSRFNLAQHRPDPTRYHALRQHFRGWLIKTPDAAFDSATPTFLDFRTPQKDEMRFFYVLPFSERRALVEYVGLGDEGSRQALEDYIERILQIKQYRTVAVEGGANPLTDQPFPRRAGAHSMTIGAAGGRIKPTSGYAFMRIQKDSAAIVDSLVRDGHPFGVPAGSRVCAACDALMLHVMQRHGWQIKPIFTTLFRRNPIRRIFRFLDETATPGEYLALIASLPPGIFLKALFQSKVLHQV
jgi:lycopene beta-cyclase